MRENQPQSKLRVGIIGCGKIAQIRHAPEYATRQDVEIAGYFDFVEERARRLAEHYGGTVFSSIAELLSCDKIDAVSVCTANATHADIAISALRSGKHVLCEKPMATTLTECQEMLTAARENGKRLIIAHNQRMCATHRKARTLLSEGAIGRPVSFKTCFGHSGPDNWSVDAGTGNWFFDKTKSAFGAVADLGIHKIDLIRFLLRSEIDSIQAMLGTLDKCYPDGTPVNVDDNASMLCRMQNGVLGTVTVSWTYYAEEENDTIIYGTDGKMLVSPTCECITILKKGSECATVHTPQGTSTGVIDAFVHAVLTDASSDLDAEKIFPAMRAMMAAIESSAKGKQIQL